ncbi:MAG: hypothetical protein HDT28_01405 [Clostridiales bacterium]|nr:hypothetical protein [Clostridiales bacterium]
MQNAYYENLFAVGFIGAPYINFFYAKARVNGEKTSVVFAIDTAKDDDHLSHIGA